MNSIDGKWSEPSKRKLKWDSQNLKKHLNHLTFPNEMEDLKLSSEKKKVEMGSLPLILHQRALSEKLLQPHKP
jgi:hypothetical protein